MRHLWVQLCCDPRLYSYCLIAGMFYDILHVWAQPHMTSFALVPSLLVIRAFTRLILTRGLSGRSRSQTDCAPWTLKIMNLEGDQRAMYHKGNPSWVLPGKMEKPSTSMSPSATFCKVFVGEYSTEVQGQQISIQFLRFYGHLHLTSHCLSQAMEERTPQIDPSRRGRLVARCCVIWKAEHGFSKGEGTLSEGIGHGTERDRRAERRIKTDKCESERKNRKWDFIACLFNPNRRLKITFT